MAADEEYGALFGLQSVKAPPMREMRIGNWVINDDSDCFVIAEIGHNHGGDLHKCIDMIDAAKAAGCAAVKLQKRTNRELYTPEFYNSPYNSPHSYGKTYGEHREALEFNQDEYRTIKAYCKEAGILFGATAFDRTALQFLGGIGVDFIKFASGDMYNLPLLEEASWFQNTPIIMSTGGARDIEDVETSYCRLTKCGANVAILQCTSGYPAEWHELDLRVIDTYRNFFPHSVIGWSMHARGISQAPVAYALGARILEAHFTLDRYAKGTDQAMSLEPDGMAAMIRYMGYTKKALGNSIKQRYPSEDGPLTKQAKNANGQVDGRTT